MIKIKTKEQLNALVAEKVMGWYHAEIIPFWNDDCGKTPYQDSVRYLHSNYWNPADDLNHAFAALEKVGYSVKIGWYGPVGYHVEIEYNSPCRYYRYGELSLAIAICCVVLKAVGVEFELELEKKSVCDDCDDLLDGECTSHLMGCPDISELELKSEVMKE